MDRTRGSLTGQLLTLFVLAVAINYPWELGQSVLFARPDSWPSMWWHCLVASAGDGLLVCLIYGAGYGAFGRQDWYEQPRARHYVLMLVVGALIAIAMEWIAVHIIRRWAYTPSMPVIPVLEIGIVPLAQMLVLPPLVFALATAYRRRVHDRLRARR